MHYHLSETIEQGAPRVLAGFLNESSGLGRGSKSGWQGTTDETIAAARSVFLIAMLFEMKPVPEIVGDNDLLAISLSYFSGFASTFSSTAST